MGNILNALLGASLGAQSQGALLPAFGQLQQRNQRTSLLEQINAAGGVNTPEGLQIAQQDPTLTQQLQTSEAQAFQARGLEQQQVATQRRQQVRGQVLTGILTEKEEEKLIIQEFIKNPAAGQELLASMNLVDQIQVNTVRDLTFDMLDATEKRRPELIVEAIATAKELGNEDLVDQLTDLSTLTFQEQNDALNVVLLATVPVEDRMALLASGKEIKRVRSSKILPDGTSIIVSDTGVEVRDASNKLLKGKAATDAIDRANQLGITLQGGRAGAREEAKLEKQLIFKPQIETAVTEAKALATERGEAFTDLSRAQAALPGLNDAVSQLRELAQIATSTIGGRIFDAAVRETGFGATTGATARSKFIAIINNQVLPLLKPTFGAAFTVQEGAELKATMGDPDTTPEQKMAQLDAFIDQKVRDIETKQRQLDQGAGVQPGAAPGAAQPGIAPGGIPEGATATNPQTGERLVFTNGQWVPVNG